MVPPAVGATASWAAVRRGAPELEVGVDSCGRGVRAVRREVGVYEAPLREACPPAEMQGADYRWFAPFSSLVGVESCVVLLCMCMYIHTGDALGRIRVVVAGHPMSK